MTRTAVYQIWRDDELLYIGASYNPWIRFGAHQSTKEWAKTATRMEIEWHQTRDAALRAERLAIAQRRPAANSLDVSGDIARKGNCKASSLVGWLSASGLTQAEFAEKVGTHFTAMSRILNGQRIPTKDVAVRIQDVTYGAVPVSVWGFRVRPADNPELLEKLINLSVQGLTRKDIAKALGVSATTVSNLLWQQGIRLPRKRSSSKYEGAMRELAQAGLTTSEAARRLRVNPAVISVAARRCGITFADGRKKGRPSSLARIERVRTLAAQGLTVSEVSRKIGVHQSEISKMKKVHSIQFINHGKQRAKPSASPATPSARATA